MLSVIIPAYNRERTIRATLDSVLSCGVDAEVIVVNDGSTDRTAEVVREYAGRATLIERPNGGPSAARNEGLARATGNVVAFLDSDDVWLPGVVADALKSLKEHPEIDVLFCDTLYGNEEKGYQRLSEATGYIRFVDLLTQPIGPELYALDRTAFVAAMIDRNQVFLGSTFFRRDRLQGGFDPELFGGEDYELCLRYAAIHRFAFCSRPLSQYEKHAGGLSASRERMAREFALAVLKFARLPVITRPERKAAYAKYRALAFGYGYLAYDAGEIREARRRFSRALRAGGFSLKSTAFYLACLLPGPVLRRCRRLWSGSGLSPVVERE